MSSERWTGKTEGTPLMHRALIGALRFMPLRLLYAVMAVCVVPFYMLFAHKGYLAAYHFFRRRFGFSPLKSFAYVYANHVRFGQVILDRFAAFAGKKFEFDLQGYDEFLALCQRPEGIVILSAHIGCYELAGYAFRSQQKRFNALVFGNEAKVMMQNRGRLFGANNIRMISIGDDLSHVFTLNEALENGEILSIPGDRNFGSARTLPCTFFGATAPFPLGPYRLALQRSVPVLAISVMKTSARRYSVCIERLDTQIAPDATRQTKPQQLAQLTANHIERMVRKYPTQWFNYYEFWD